jgi:hypothetical protein
MSTEHQVINDIKVNNKFYDFIDQEVCVGLGHFCYRILPIIIKHSS